MLKMVIWMDENKINTEKIYPLEGIYSTIDRAFSSVGLMREDNQTGELVYRDVGRAQDFSLFGRIVNAFKKQDWFMDNVSVWQLCESDDFDDSLELNEEDLLEHYRNKQSLRA